MFKRIQERIFPFIIAISALSVSTSAAFYSISGLSKLFAGASLEVTIMATSLEVSKLVIASLLYKYRKTLPTTLKYYLTTATVILVLITSMGIYGFLTSSYQTTSDNLKVVEQKIDLIENKKDNINRQLTSYNKERDNIIQSTNSLRDGLSDNKIQYKDKETGRIITTTSGRNRRVLQNQLDKILKRQQIVNTRIDSLNSILFEYETKITKIKSDLNVAGELGPLRYLSGLIQIEMNRIINYLVLIIIFVFDPLAISLVIAANYAFEQIKLKESSTKDIEEVPSGETKETPSKKTSPKKHLGKNTLFELAGKSQPYKKEDFFTEKEKKILENPSVSSWRKNKIKKIAKKRNDEDNTIKYN
jgi:hypothetical protein